MTLEEVKEINCENLALTKGMILFLSVLIIVILLTFIKDLGLKNGVKEFLNMILTLSAAFVIGFVLIWFVMPWISKLFLDC